MDGTADQTGEHGRFERPIFRDPSARRLARVGVIDVGSNSVRLVIFDGAARSPAYFYNEKIMCALGEGLAATGHLNPDGRRRALAAMHRFARIAEGLNLATLTAVGTAAVREAADGPDFVAEVERETGIRVHVVPGEEEARLSAQGVLLGWPGAYGLVCDMGGASMELAEINGGTVGRCVTSALGPLQLKAVKGGRKGRKAHIRAVLKDLSDQLGPQHDRLFLVGGSWRAFARIDMERRGYPLHVLHEYRMSRKAVIATGKFIAEADPDKLRRACGLSQARMALVPYAAEVLKEIVRIFHPHDIAVSSYGIREGLLYEEMPDHVRQRDPLIEACRFAEAKDARLPGFGDVLYDFIRPIFRRLPDQRRRIIRAACLLHDVSWRAHPDYRAEVCFDNATRANLGGLRHRERIYMGLALMYRYTNRVEQTPFRRTLELLSDDDRREAEVVGKAMRFGAMLSMRRDRPAGTLSFAPRKKVLKLNLPAENAPLFGEVAEARFVSLARSLDARPEVVIGARKAAATS